MTYWAIVTTDAEILYARVGLYTALCLWNPGTWLGKGGTKEEAIQDALDWASTYREFLDKLETKKDQDE